MKVIVCLMPIFVLSIFNLHSQNIGLRSDYSFSGAKNIYNYVGGGIYLNINGFSKRVELLFAGDYNTGHKNFYDENYTSSYYNYSFMVSPLYNLLKKGKLKVKVGPSVGYYIIYDDDIDFNFGVVNAYKSKDVGIGVILDTQFEKIFNSDFNIDAFLTPDCLINTYYNNYFSSSNPIYYKPIEMINIGVGISYGD